MDPWLIALIIALIGVIMHGIFTGLALVATWYFGHMAEKKILDEAKAIHKEVTDKIAEMNKAEAEYDKIDAFLDQQKQVLSGFRSEIARVIGEENQKAIAQIPRGGTGPQGEPSALDKVLAVAASFAGQ